MKRRGKPWEREQICQPWFVWCLSDSWNPSDLPWRTGHLFPGLSEPRGGACWESGPTMPVSMGVPALKQSINKQIHSQENTLLIFQIPRDHPVGCFSTAIRKKELKNENEPFSFSCHFYQSSTFHHHVRSQSCYKPTADTSNALSTVWPTSRGMKGTIIQNSHLLWVMSHSWKEGNNTIVQEKGHFSRSPGCLHRSKAGYALRRKPHEGLWWGQETLEILSRKHRNASISDELFL